MSSPSRIARPASMHRRHRDRAQDALAASGTAAVIPTHPERLRNGDSEYRFRPGSDFWYLTGFGEPEATLVLLPGLPGASEEARRQRKSLLFLRERDPALEIWTGRRLGVERAPELLGVDEAHPAGSLWERLPELLRGYERIAWQTGIDPDRDRRMLDTFGLLRRTAKRQVRPPSELVDPGPILHELRLRKGPEELERMRRAVAISAEAHGAAMRAVRPGMGENEIDAILHSTFLRLGAQGSAYTNIVAGGANACILHYVENRDSLRDGDLLLVDAGAEVDCYASDITRTFPVNGRFRPEQRAIYELVLEAQRASIARIAPGESVEALHQAALECLVAGMIRLGLLEGDPESAIAKGSYRRFYMHGTGHWLGLDVHDCGAYRDQSGAPRRLEAGMVTTVEPGLYIQPDDETVEERWRGIGVRIEDDVLVTEEGCEVLSAAIPKSVEEVEAACRGESPVEIAS